MALFTCFLLPHFDDIQHLGVLVLHHCLQLLAATSLPTFLQKPVFGVVDLFGQLGILNIQGFYLPL
jgi:hypothetical protein